MFARPISTVLALLAATSYAQTPDALAKTIVGQWATASEAEFAASYPFREGRKALAAAVNAKAPRRPGLASVVRATADRAVLLLSATPLLPNSGDATVYGRGFSGLYQARRADGRWELAARIPLDEAGAITAHHLSVSIQPARSLNVSDRMRINVKSGNGFAARLNHAARISDVRNARGGKIAYQFGGGLLWLDLPPGETEITIDYTIEVEKGPDNTNSGCFREASGHVRGQYFWHPFFDFNASADWAGFEMEVRIPSEYRVSTSLPQTERILGPERVVSARSNRRHRALTLIYDRDWTPPEESQPGSPRLNFLLTPGFQPDRAAIADEFRLVHELLSGRFGPLPGGSLSIVEARSFQENPGWRFASNQIVVAAGHPRVISMGQPVPMAPLAHEIAHLWTDAAIGPASTFLTEGWAAYVEALVIEKRFGVEAARRFWKLQGDIYLAAFEGKRNLLEDDDNEGIAYSKGAWVMRMLEDAIGAEAFDRTMSAFSRPSRTGQGWEHLASFARQYADPQIDVRAFLLPWLEEESVPRITAAVSGRKVAITQEPAKFTLPLTVVVTTQDGTERRRIWIHPSETAITFSGDVSGVQIDPDGLLLLRR